MIIVWSSEARRSLRAIRRYIAQDSEFYAGRTVARIVERIIGTAHIFIAVVFWLIDLRGCRILSVCAEALSDLEKTYIDGLAERQINEDRRKNKRGLWRLVSYRNCFMLIFAVHAAFGAILAWNPKWLLSP